MLKKFAVTNYRGFKNRMNGICRIPATIPLTMMPSGMAWSRMVSSMGPNGAGKSNFGLALFDIANHLSHKWKKPDYYLNYACAAHYDEPVDFEYTFALDGHRCGIYL